MLKDISISSSWKKPWDANRGRPTSRKQRTQQRKLNQKKPVKVLFIDKTFLDYNKNNFGKYSLIENCWNDGFKFKQRVKE